MRVSLTDEFGERQKRRAALLSKKQVEVFISARNVARWQRWAADECGYNLRKRKNRQVKRQRSTRNRQPLLNTLDNRHCQDWREGCHCAESPWENL